MYASGLAICAACALVILSQVNGPVRDFLHPDPNPPIADWSQPPRPYERTNPQVTGSLPTSSPLTDVPVGGGLMPTPSEIAPQRPTQSATESPVTTSTPAPHTTTRPPAARPPQRTTAPRPPAPPTTTKPKPPVVINPPALPPVKVPLTPLCNGLNVLPQASRGCNDILGNVVGALTGVTAVGGRGSRPDNPTSCHPKGLALDLMVRSRLTGDLIAAYARLNKTRLGITTILWQVPDHYDHVHLSFAPCTH
jgi:hypothetical protein